MNFLSPQKINISRISLIHLKGKVHTHISPYVHTRILITLAFSREA